MTEVIKLVSLRTPLPKVEFPNGRVLQVIEATALTERLIREMNVERTEARVRAVLSNLVPDATDEDWESTSTEDARNILDIALRKTTAAIEIVEGRRKNDDGETGGSPAKKKKPRTPRSPQTMTSRTDARA